MTHIVVRHVGRVTRQFRWVLRYGIIWPVAKRNRRTRPVLQFLALASPHGLLSSPAPSCALTCPSRVRSTQCYHRSSALSTRRTLAICISVSLGGLDDVLFAAMQLPIAGDRMHRFVPATSLSMATPFRFSVVVDFIIRDLGSSVASNDT